MKKIKLFLFAAVLLGSVGLHASNTITYTATEQLPGYIGSLNKGATTFGPAITSHTFSNGTGVITCNGEITQIGEAAFYGCTGLTSIEIPNSVDSIRLYAFQGCTGLTSIEIPNSVIRIRGNAFWACSGLTSVTVSWTDSESIASIASSSFGLIANGAGRSGATLHVPNGTAALYQQADEWKVFGNIVEYINTITYTATAKLPGYYGTLQVGATTFGPAITSHEFSNGTGIITCSGEITTIGNYVFYNHTGLTSIEIPNSVKIIGMSAFSYCSGLTSITIPNSVTTIGEHAFYYCSSLTSVTIPNSVTTIGNYAFGSCYGLTSVTIGNSVTTIGEFVFRDCSGLTSITIPNSVTTIGDFAFRDCSGLTVVTVSWTDEKSIPSINSNVFEGIAHGSGPAGAELCVPKGTKELYQQANVWNTFGGIESDITKINDLWYRILNVRAANVIANQYITTTGERIPYSGDVVIPKTIIYDDGNNSIAAIEDSAFYNAKLTSLTVLTDFPLPCSEHTFTGQDKSIPLYVLDVPAFQSAKYWKEFTNILFYQPYKEAAKKKVQDIVNGIPSQYASLAKPIADNYFQNIENVNTIRQVDDLTARTLKQLQVFYDQGLWIKSGDYWLLKGKELLK